MVWLTGLVAVLVAFGSLLAVAESSISRMTRVRAVALRQEGRWNAALLERIELDPAPYLNSVYLAGMFVQNGSAILVAILSEGYFGDLGIMLVAVAFTLAYFVVVEAMSKTFGVLHSDRAALMVVPVVWVLGRLLAHPTRALIGLANVLLPGKGLKQGPFVSQEDIRSMAEVGHEEGVIAESEKLMIHSVFAFSDTVVSRIMTPRPDIVALEIESPLSAVLDVIRQHGFSRIPVYRGDLDRVEGVIHVTDVVSALQQADGGPRPADLMRSVRFVPESKRLVDLLREMRLDKFHLAIVVNEYGSTAGLVTLEDVLEELVGEIADEHDVEERDVEPIGDGVYRVDASVGVRELNELLGADLPHDRWNTVGGLLFALVGTIPTEGQSVTLKGFRFTAEKVQGRRVTMVLVAPEHVAAVSAASR